MSDPASNAANYIAFISTTFTIGTAYNWYLNTLEATGRLESLDAAHKGVNDLFEDLIKQTEGVTITPQERRDFETQAATLRMLKRQLRAAQEKAMHASFVQKNWQWGQFVNYLKDLNNDLVKLKADVLSTTNKLNDRSDEPPSPTLYPPQAVYQPPRGHSRQTFNCQRQYSGSGAPASVVSSSSSPVTALPNANLWGDASAC